MAASKMKTFIAKLKHDSGTFRLQVRAGSVAAARQAIKAAEGCPDRAIISLKEQDQKGQVRILFTTDAWHNHSSKVMIGVFTRMDKALKAAGEHAKQSEEGEISGHDLELLQDIGQTQGRGENYIIETRELNTIF